MPPDGGGGGGSGHLRKKERIQYLSLEDRIRVEFTLQGRDVVEMMVQLECEIGGEFKPCRRYDTEHGVLHVHPEAWTRHPNVREIVPVTTLSAALTRALDDLIANYPAYRAHLEARFTEGRS